MKTKFTTIATLALITLSTSGCGLSKTNGVMESKSTTMGSSGASNPQAPTVIPYNPSTPAPSTPPSQSAFVPMFTQQFEITGLGGTKTTQVIPLPQTDNVLRIRVRAGSALPIGAVGGQPYSNFTASYSCISYVIKVAGQSVQTQTLSPNGGGYACAGASQTQEIDLSDRVRNNPGNLTLEVTNPRYDYYCDLLITGRMYVPNPSQYFNVYCPSFPVYQNHRVSGTIEIMTN